MSNNLLRSITIFFILLLYLSPKAKGQEYYGKNYRNEGRESFTLITETSARLSSGATASFWTTHGQGGRRSLSPQSFGTDLYADYGVRFGKVHHLAVSAELIMERNIEPFYRIRQAGISYLTPWLGLQIGALEKSNPIAYSPQTSGAMAGSNNSLPIPTVRLHTNNFQPLPWTSKWFKFYIDLAYGRFWEDRFNALTYPNAERRAYTLGTLWHEKSGYLQFGKADAVLPLVFTIGGSHMAQFGGRHYQHERSEPATLKDFIRIALAKKGDNDASSSDKINVLGNHYGQYLLQLELFTKHGKWQLYHQHIFEDKSGMEFSNGTDGLWGLHYTFNRSWRGVKHLLIEYITTTHQSGPFHILTFDRPNGEGKGGGKDNYYYNSEYRSGATYLGMNIGSPLLVNRLYKKYYDMPITPYHSRVQALHFGLSGEVQSLGGLNYEGKLTWVKSYGNMDVRLAKPISSSYTYLRLLQPLPPHPAFQVGIEFGADFGNYTPATYSATLTLRYHLNIQNHKE